MKLYPGDVVEIETLGGLAYAQVTHNHPSYPEVVRALPGLYESRPASIEWVTKEQSLFIAMLPLGDAIEKKRLKATKIGATAIPKQSKSFPTFRMPIRDKKGGVAYWWFWDGDGLSYETELDLTSSNFPMREVMSVDAFLRKLA